MLLSIANLLPSVPAASHAGETPAVRKSTLPVLSGVRLPSLPVDGRSLPVVRETHDEALEIQRRVMAMTTTELRNATLQQPSQAELDLARERAEALRLYHDYRQRGYTRELAAARIRSAHQDRFQLLPTAGKNGGNAINERNLDNWGLAIRTERGTYDYCDMRALVPSYKKGLRDRGFDPQFWLFFGSHYLKLGGPSMNECFRLALADCRRYGVTNVPRSVSPVRKWYQDHVDEASIEIARRGKDIFGERYQYFIQRDWEGVEVNDIWFSDHHDLDCPCHVETDKGKVRPARLTLTAMMDAASLYIVGWQISVGAGSNYTIMTSLGLGICTAGLRTPLNLYVDNGADYRALGFDEPVQIGEHGHSVCRQLGVGVTSSIPYRAQAKTIERRFKDVCEWFAKRWAGYLGNRPGMRSAAADFLWANPELLPSYDELVAEFAIWLDEVYHERPSKGEILRGKCPREVWDGRHDMRPEWNKDLLRAAMLMPRGTRMVQQGPSITIDGHRYYSDRLMPHLRKPGDGGKVMYKIDRWDSSHVYCFTFDGKPICEARLRERIGAFCLDDPDERAKIGQAERLKGHQLRRAMTAIEMETGGTYRLADPRDRILALTSGDDYEMRKVGTRNSVKGGTHNYEHYVLVERGAELPVPSRKVGRRKVAGLVQGPGMGAAGLVQEARDPEIEALSSDELADVHRAIMGAAAEVAEDGDDFGPVDAGMFGGSEQGDDDPWQD